jgi:hypothetical protein
MDLLTALKILIRRYPVVLTGLMLTVLGVFQVGRMIEPTYEAKSTVLLLSPGSSTTNPFNEFGANLEVTADAIMVVLQSPVGGEKLEAAGATGGFKLERTQGPLIDITASAPSERAATRTVEVVVAGLREELETRQASSPVEQHITVSELTQPVAKPKLGSRIRAQAATLAVGLTATVAAGLAVDALMRQRQESKLRRQALAEALAERGDDWYPPSHAGTSAPTPRSARAAEPRRDPAPNGTHSGAPTVPVLNSGTVNGRSSVYRPKPSRSSKEVPADAPPLPAGAPVAQAAPKGPPAPPADRPAGARHPGERSLTDRLAVDLSSGARPAPDGLAERPPLARRPAGPPPGPPPAPRLRDARPPASPPPSGPQPSKPAPARDARPPASPPPSGPQPSKPAPAGDARPSVGAPAADSRQPQDGKAAEAPRANLP